MPSLFECVGCKAHPSQGVTTFRCPDGKMRCFKCGGRPKDKTVADVVDVLEGGDDA